MNDNKREAKYIIIGAGLSGLTTAYTLLENGENDFLILEGSHRMGGRIRTKNNIDLGATWFQDHHTNLNHLLHILNIKKFEQFSKGQSVLVYNTMAPAHYFETQEGAPAAYRIAGGSAALINKLKEAVGDTVVTGANVEEFLETKTGITVKTSKGDYQANTVVLTIPPKLASTLKYTPELPQAHLKTMQGTHTWMSNAIKLGLVFKTPFWRKKDLSGTVIGQVGPVIELYDHCNAKDDVYTLMGFVNEGLRGVTPKNRKERILSYLEKYLGPEIRNHIAYFEKDWSTDKFTSCDNLKSVYMSPQYGNPVYENFQMNGKLLFSGTETSPVYGGYLDGAVYSGIRAANLLMTQVLT